jgi:cell division protein FtsL
MMSIAMLVMLLLVCSVVCGVGVAAFRLGSRQLPPVLPPGQSPRLSDQDERIELLEDELQRLRDQADFTEKLLSERSGPEPKDAPGGDGTD